MNTYKKISLAFIVSLHKLCTRAKHWLFTDIINKETKRGSNNDKIK